MRTRFSASFRQYFVLPGLVLALGAPAIAQEPVADVELPHSKLIQSVTVSPLVAFAGADLRIIVRVQPEAGNRRLQLSVDAPMFYASTERQLDGVDGARAHSFSLHELPAGDYLITAVLEGNDGIRSRITRQFKVMGENDEVQPSEVRPPTRGRRRGSE